MRWEGIYFGWSTPYGFVPLCFLLRRFWAAFFVDVMQCALRYAFVLIC